MNAFKVQRVPSVILQITKSRRVVEMLNNRADTQRVLGKMKLQANRILMEFN